MHVNITSSAWLLTANCKALGANFTPSVRKVIGAKRANDMTVMIDKRLTLSRGSCRPEEGKGKMWLDICQSIPVTNYFLLL